jgi:hypothetical protein
MADNEITDIGRGTFKSVSRIGTIDLARNKIKAIDFQMFHELQYVEVNNHSFINFIIFIPKKCRNNYHLFVGNRRI